MSANQSLQALRGNNEGTQSSRTSVHDDFALAKGIRRLAVLIDALLLAASWQQLLHWQP